METYQLSLDCRPVDYTTGEYFPPSKEAIKAGKIWLLNHLQFIWPKISFSEAHYKYHHGILRIIITGRGK